MSRKFRIVLTLLCFVAAFGCAFAYGEGIRKEEQQIRGQTLARFGGEVVQLVVTTRDLSPGDTVTPADVALADWVVDLAPTSAYTSVDEVVGKTLTSGAAKNTLLSSYNFQDDASYLEVPKGMVAISVPMTERLCLPADLKPRSRVCAWVSGKQGASLLSQNVVVLSFPDGGAKSGSSRQQKMITLAVEPNQVGKFLEASSLSQLKLVVPAQDVSDAGLQSADTNAASAGTHVNAIDPGEPEKPSDDKSSDTKADSAPPAGDFSADGAATASAATSGAATSSEDDPASESA